jgi:hypothetical protein
MKSNELIQNLSLNLQPVKSVKYGLKEYSFALLAGLFSTLAGIALTGLRSDIQNIVLTASFITQSLALILLAILSTVSALQMSIPSLTKSVSQNIVLGTLAFWVMTLLYLLINSNSPFAGWGFSCSTEILLNSVVPAAVIFFMVSKAATLNRISTGWLILTAGAAFGAIATQFSCNSDDALHLLVWHTLPVVVIGLVGTLIGKFILKKV